MTEFEAAVPTELTRIRELLERREAGETNLLRVIHQHVHDTEFTSSELLRFAAQPENGQLRAALECEFDDPNSRRIGKFLASIASVPIGNFIVESIGLDREGLLWRVRVCEAKHTLPVVRQADAVMLRIHDGGIGK